MVIQSALRKATMRSIDYGACALGGVVAILISLVLDNGSGALLVGTIVLIITSIKYIKKASTFMIRLALVGFFAGLTVSPVVLI